MSHQPRRTVRSFIAAVAVALTALAAPAAVMPAVSADPLPPTEMVVAAHTDPSVASALSGVPAGSLPAVLTAVGEPFQVEVSLQNLGAPAAFITDVPVTFTASGGGDLAVIGSATIPAFQSTATFTLTYSVATPALTVTASTQADDESIAIQGTTAAFPVDLALTVLDGQSAALRGGTAGADGSGCAVVDAQHPMCGILSLPRGATGNAALTLGACPVAGACIGNGLVTQFLADMEGLYTRTAPAKMTIVCDKTLCGQGGVPQYRARWATTATGALVTTQACPAKGVIGAGQDFCTDWKASNRDKAGDLRLVVLFLTDVRGTI